MKFGQLTAKTDLQKQMDHLNFLTGSLQLSKAYSDANENAIAAAARTQTLGVDHLINTWLRQQQAYRQQFVTDMFILSMTIEEIRAPIQHIIGEVFRKGIQWAPKFAVKCSDCNTEYTELLAECKKCKSTDLKEPDESQKQKLDSFISDCNVFDQSLEEVLRETHYDLNVIDDAYIYLGKEYVIDSSDNKVRSKVVEIRKLNPALVELELDKQGLPKNFHWFCYLHRTETVTTEAGECEFCGHQKVPAMYKYNNRGSVLYLTDSEIIHLQKFWPHETYGWSPIMTIFEKALTLIGMDKNLYRYFFERKLPSGIIMVFTDEADSLRRERENLAVQMKKDPNYLPMVAVSAKTGRGRVDFVKLFHTLQEMDYLPVRQEIRERIAAMWGVTPAWQGAPEAYGGLSTQTTQLTVMSRIVENDQRLYHSKVFPLLLEAFGVTDWKLELPQPEEKAEVTRLQFAQQRAGIASMLFQMGFDVKIKSSGAGIDEIDFVVSGEAKRQESPFGNLGSSGEMGAGAGMPREQTDQQPSLNLSSNDRTWLGEILKRGYRAPIIKEITKDGIQIIFENEGQIYLADFGMGMKSPVIVPVVTKQTDVNNFVTPKTMNHQVIRDQDEEEDEE